MRQPSLGFHWLLVTNLTWQVRESHRQSTSSSLRFVISFANDMHDMLANKTQVWEAFRANSGLEPRSFATHTKRLFLLLIIATG